MSATPWIGLFSVDNVTLRHYSLPDTLPDPATKKNTILILFGLINYPDILDLHPERSIVRRLLEKGLDVYLVDWGEPPCITEKPIRFQDYVGYVKKIVDFLNKPDLNIMGVCQGGIFSLLFATLFPEKYNKLILYSSPVDFSEHNAFTQSFSCINSDQMVKNFGNIPGLLMAKFLALFSPFPADFIKRKIQAESASKKSSSFYQALANWAYQSPAQAGFAFQEFGNEYIHQNKLIKAELNIFGREVNLNNIYRPLLNIFASEDHIWSPSSSKAIKKYLHPDTPYTELEFVGGHLAAAISKEAQAVIPSKIVDFINHSHSCMPLFTDKISEFVMPAACPP